MLPIANFAFGGYRSFGREVQYFGHLAKINLFIGQNNAGKSNILRFLHELYPRLSSDTRLPFGVLDEHLPDRPTPLVGIAMTLDADLLQSGGLPPDYPLLSTVANPEHRRLAAGSISRLLAEKAKRDRGGLCWALISLINRQPVTQPWAEAAKVLSDSELYQLWNILTNQSGGSRSQNWEPEVFKRLFPQPPELKVQLIPAIRKIGEGGSTSEGFDGVGIIDRLAKLQNPGVHNQSDRKRFNDIQDFLRSVLGQPDAVIEVPYDRQTIQVHMEGKVLPMDSLGSGIHEVIILAAAATVLENHVLAIEEPEIHLNPILQRKLIRYLSAKTSNQYFITTHSAALMDTPGAEIYHVSLNDGASFVNRVTSDRQRSAVCEDLGYHPSDLLQANCVIWVEGPSDRVYLNWWLKSLDRALIEGIHYSIMFYGGRLAAHLSHADEESDVQDFISLRRLNRRGVIMIDSDRETPDTPLNATKRRLQDEFDKGPGHAWITAGREIENYIPAPQLDAALRAICPKAQAQTQFGKFDNSLRIQSAGGKQVQAPKVDIARYITERSDPDLSAYDLRERLTTLVQFVHESNPAIGHTDGSVDVTNGAAMNV